MVIFVFSLIPVNYGSTFYKEFKCVTVMKIRTVIMLFCYNNTKTIK